MKYLTEEKFEKEIEALRLREFASFKDEMIGFKRETEIHFLQNEYEHGELKEMTKLVQVTVDKIYQMLDRDVKWLGEHEADHATIHQRVDRVEKYLGPGFQKTLSV